MLFSNESLDVLVEVRRNVHNAMREVGKTEEQESAARVCACDTGVSE